MTASADLLSRLQASNLIRGGLVTVHHRSGGYSLHASHTGQPVARLRPTGTGDCFEVLYPAQRGRWRPFGDFGGIVLPLDKALEFIETSGFFPIAEPWTVPEPWWRRFIRALPWRRRRT